MAKASASKKPVGGKRRGVEANTVFLLWGLGTTGHEVVTELLVAHPEYQERVGSLDGERDKRLVNKAPYRLNTGHIRHLETVVEHRHLHPMIRDDALLDVLTWPDHIGPGAGTARIIGGIKVAAVLEEFSGRVQRMLQRALADFKGTKLETVLVQLVLGAGGGQGSGSLIPAILTIRDVCRRFVPEARVHVVVHALNPTCYASVITDRSVLQKHHANAEALYLELAYSQRWKNVEKLVNSLGLSPLRTPLIEEWVDYHGSDVSGQSYAEPSSNIPRIITNILATANESLASQFVDRDKCNMGVVQSRAADGPERIVTSCQSAIAGMNTVVLCEAFAVAWLSSKLDELLSDATEKRVQVLVPKTLQALGVENMRDEVLRRVRKVKKDLVREDLTDHTATKGRKEALAILREDHGRFSRAVEASLYELKMNVLTYANREMVPAAVQRAEELLRSSARCMGEVLEAFREVERQVRKLHDEEREAITKAAEERRACAERVEEAFGKLAGGGLFGGGHAKEEAVEVSLAHQQAVLQATFYELTDEVLQALETGLEDRIARYQQVEQVLYLADADTKANYRQLARAIAADTTLVVTPAESRTLIKKLYASYRQKVGELPPLPLKVVLEAGTREPLVSHYERTHAAIEAFFKGHVPDVTSFASLLGLEFDLATWVVETLRTLGRSAPLDLAAVGSVPEQVVVIAAGDDLEVVRRAVASYQGDTEVKVEEGGADTRCVSVTKRIAGMPLTSLPVRKDTRRAALRFSKPGPGVPAADLIISSGLLAPATASLWPDEEHVNNGQPPVPEPHVSPPTKRRGGAVARDGATE
jgi:hypothetical protein